MMQVPRRQTGGNRQGAPVPQRQLPETQLSASSPQSLPQRPQWFSSFCVSRQLPLQQSEEPLHTRPHAPQLPTSVLVLTQAPPQHA